MHKNVFAQLTHRNIYWQSLLYLCLCLFPVIGQALTPKGMERISISINETEYSIEVADDAASRRQGLMHRASLKPNEGMLFVYPQTGFYRIWMKDMLIPLWVIWIDEELRVASVKKLEPCEKGPCPVYGASKPGRYILELSIDAQPVKPGDRVKGIKH